MAAAVREGLSSDNAKGLVLAVSSSAFIGASFIVKKMGLRRAADSGVRAGESARFLLRVRGCLLRRLDLPAVGLVRRSVGWSIRTLARGVEVGLRQPCGCSVGSSSTEALKLIFFLYFFVPFCDAVSGGCSWFGWCEGSAGGRKNVVGCSIW
jgi:hypothetical protein